MTRDKKRRQELEHLNKAELIASYLLLKQRFASLEGQITALKQALGIKPDNSSVPPSQGQKANLPPKKKIKRGPKQGHIGTSRHRQDPDELNGSM
ncbi:MAG TPA: hypothetical protein VHO69_18020 [Phototrophicaceae bacterium]|nr:hypothetical protein [Phototrophicaceae bacterium]